MERPDLLQKATHLITVREGESYHWISPDELLILRPVLTPPGCLGNWLPLAWIRALLTVHTAHRYTISTGVETPLEEFNRLHTTHLPSRTTIMPYGRVETPVQPVYHDPPQLQVSPDGRWALWERRFGHRRVASLDGRRTVDWPYGYEDGGARWLPDSSRWLGIIAMSKGGIVDSLRLHRWSDPAEKEMITLSERVDGTVVGITSRYSLLMYHPTGPVWFTLRAKARDSLHESFSEIYFGAQKAEVRRFAIKMPQQVVVLEVRLSPNGNRLAWLTQTIFTDDEPHSGQEFCIWVSDLDGADFRDIGWVNAQVFPSEDIEGGTVYAAPRGICWSPDSTHISFTYGRKVMAVPVDST